MDERSRFVTSSEDEFHAVDMQSSSSHRNSSIKCNLSMCNVALCTFVLRLQQQHLVGISNSTHATYNIWQSFKCMKGILNCWSTSPIIVMYNDNIANQRVSVMRSLARATWMIDDPDLPWCVTIHQCRQKLEILLCPISAPKRFTEKILRQIFDCDGMRYFFDTSR